MYARVDQEPGRPLRLFRKYRVGPAMNGPGRMAAKIWVGSHAERTKHPGESDQPHRKKRLRTSGEESDRLIVVMTTGNLLEGTHRRGRRNIEPQEGKMTGSLSSGLVSTKQARIAKIAKQMPGTAIRSLSHNMDLEWMREAYRRTRKDGAVGVDGQTAKAYAEHLDDNLRSLLERAKSGSYRAPPVRRVYIPKGDGSETRPIGVPTFEDKVLQRAVAMLLEPIYEEDFYDLWVPTWPVGTRCARGPGSGHLEHGWRLGHRHGYSTFLRHVGSWGASRTAAPTSG
jgi:hypothetical protein